MIRTILSALVALIVGATAAQAADFPTKAVRIIVPFAAGGASDIATRALADGLSALWKQPVVVDNRPGGGTIVGTNVVARAAPDGYTLGAFTPTFVINPAVRSSMPYNSVKDLVGVSMIVESPSAIVANASFPANNLDEMIAEAKKRGGNPVTFASVGEGSFGHMTGERLQRLTGIKLKHVPYSGSTQALPDVVAGRVDLFLTAWQDVRAYVDTKQLKLIAPYSDIPLAGVENPPPSLGKVFPGFDARAFTGLQAPGAIPKDLLNKISADVRTVLSTPEFKRVSEQFAASPWPTSPEETDKIIEKAINDWTEVAKDQGIKLN